jgi:hypothetical protein
MTRSQERGIRARDSKVSTGISVLAVTHEEEEYLCADGFGAELLTIIPEPFETQRKE